MGDTVTKGFLLKQMARLELNYGKDKFKAGQEMFDLWYDYFKDCKEERLKQAVDKCIKENEFAPNVAGLMKYYKALDEAHNEYTDLVRHQYGIMKAIWGEKEDAGTLLELYNYSMRYPENQRKTLLVEYVHQAISFKHDCDACGRVQVPTIKEYIQGAR